MDKETRIKYVLRFVKCLAITLVTLPLLLFLLLNVVFTSDRLASMIHGYADEYLDADCHFVNPEVTFFSSFPRFGLSLDSVVIVSNVYHHDDSTALYTRFDTLLTAPNVVVGVNIFKSLSTHAVSIGSITLDKPVIDIKTDEAGLSNWDMLKPDDSPADSVTQADTSSWSWHICGLDICNGDFRYNNRLSSFYLAIRNVNAEFDGFVGPDMIDLDVALLDEQTSFGYDRKRYINRLSLGLNGHVDYSADSSLWRFSDMLANIDGHDVNVDGRLGVDSLGVDVDVRFGVASPSVRKLFDMIPKDFIAHDVDVENGVFNGTGSYVGRSDAHSMPVLRCNVFVDHVKAHYDGKQNGIDDLSAYCDILIDPQNPDSSMVIADVKHFKGGDSEFAAYVRLTNLFSNVDVDCKMNGHVDLESVLDIFPILNTRMSGIVDGDISTRFSMADIERMDYGRVKVKGKLDVNRLSIVNDSLDFNLHSDAHMNFVGEDTLKAQIKMSNLDLNRRDLILKITGFESRIKTPLSYDTASIVNVRGDFSLSRFRLKHDTVAIYAKNVKSRMSLRSSSYIKTKPRLRLQLDADTIYSGIYGVRGFTQMLHSTAFYEPVTDSTWNSDGLIEAQQIKAMMPRYKLPLQASNIRMTQKQRTIAIVNTQFRVGKSSFLVNAETNNLYYALMTHSKLRASLSVDADTLDVNELMSAYVDDSSSPLQTAAISDTSFVVVHRYDSLAVDSVATPRFVTIPKNIRFSMKTKVKQLMYSDFELQHVDANVELVDGCAHLTKMLFNHGDTKGISIMAYKGDPVTRKGQLCTFVRLERTDIAEIISKMHLDSIIPALSPFKGRVDCYFTFKTTVDSLMNPDIYNAVGSMHVGANGLVVLDNETFSKISKNLMFKNKKENVIDSISFNLLLDSSRVEVLPFVAVVDRYKVVIGGHQSINPEQMRLNYHVSIINSPLPFKAGLNITGELDNLEYDVTTAKLKKYNTKERQLENDNVSLQRRFDMIRDAYMLSGLPIPQQLQTDAERKQAELQAKIQAVLADEDEEEGEDEE